MQANKLSQIKNDYRLVAKQGAYPHKDIFVSSNAKVEASQSGAWVHIQVWIPAQRIGEDK